MRKSFVMAFCALALSACAAQAKNAPAASPAAESPATGSAPQAYPVAPGGAPSPQGAMPSSPPPLSPHAAAVQGAANELDSSQRELDVAAGDCRNACRALGSMDRAAGRLCGLTQGQPDANRCEDAKQHVYTARDRVKKTCGQCDGGPSVDRDAPIPSLR